MNNLKWITGIRGKGNTVKFVFGKEDEIVDIDAQFGSLYFQDLVFEEIKRVGDSFN